MFGFLDMIYNYEDRKVDRFEGLGIFVDTAYVTDAAHPYETAVKHPDYNNGEMIIVEAYDTKEDAQKGHAKWVATMTENPPAQLVDCQNADISRLLPKGSLVFPRVIEVDKEK